MWKLPSCSRLCGTSPGAGGSLHSLGASLTQVGRLFAWPMPLVLVIQPLNLDGGTLFYTLLNIHVDELKVCHYYRRN